MSSREIVCRAADLAHPPPLLTHHCTRGFGLSDAVGTGWARCRGRERCHPWIGSEVP